METDKQVVDFDRPIEYVDFDGIVHRAELLKPGLRVQGSDNILVLVHGEMSDYTLRVDRHGMSMHGTKPCIRNVPKTFVRYINFYEDQKFGATWETRQDADRGSNFANRNRIGCLRVECVEGQFDE